MLLHIIWASRRCGRFSGSGFYMTLYTASVEGEHVRLSSLVHARNLGAAHPEELDRKIVRERA